jgi:hypothetical protein
MTILPKHPPSSVRPESTMSAASSGTRFPEPRPYLIPVSGRRSVKSENLPLFPHESEDARLTGATRSLFRRLLALNLPVSATETLTIKTRTVKTSQTSFGRTA